LKCFESWSWTFQLYGSRSKSEHFYGAKAKSRHFRVKKGPIFHEMNTFLKIKISGKSIPLRNWFSVAGGWIEKNARIIYSSRNWGGTEEHVYMKVNSGFKNYHFVCHGLLDYICGSFLIPGIDCSSITHPKIPTQYCNTQPFLKPLPMSRACPLYIRMSAPSQARPKLCCVLSSRSGSSPLYAFLLCGSWWSPHEATVLVSTQAG
jgi:hypothetical protein